MKVTPKKVEKSDYNNLTNAIIKAHYYIREQEEKIVDKETEEWQKTIGLKDYSEYKGFIGSFLRFSNKLSCFKKVLFLKKEEAKTSRTTYLLIRSAAEGMFSFVKWILYFVALCLFIGAFIDLQNKTLHFYPICLIYSLLSWLVARIVRIGSFEISNMKDRQQLLAIISVVTAMISLVIAVIALFVR